MATVNLGNIKFKWKGTYAAGTAYTVDDVVSYNGSSYICISATTGNLPTVTAKWEQMSSAGTNGTDLTSTLTAQGDIVYRDGSGLAKLGAGTSGQFLKTSGTGANPVWADAGGGLQSMQTFTSNGTYTKPTGINKIKVYVTGGGASGGGGANQSNDYGGGGGAGGTAIEIIDVSSLSSTVAVTVGTGGAATSGSSPGAGGNASSFGSYCSATGGSGGRHGNQGNVRGGYSGVGSGGNLNLYGQAGGGGNDDGSTHEAAGTGGSSFWSGGGLGAASGQGGTAAQRAGYQGSGGGGGNDAIESGAGGTGLVVVEEYK